jgi:pSer/pThr/pTyr-binding forkhead associated (FHA) protein
MSDDAELMTQTAEQEDSQDEELAEEPTETLAGQGTLIVKRGGVETEDVFTFAPPAIIGRFDPEKGPVDIDLGGIPEGQYVSRKHAKITREGETWTIEDLGSSNGTYILRGDFERVESAPIEDGDEIALGNARFVFKLS